MSPSKTAALALPRIVVLVSGSGTNLQALIDAVAAGAIEGRVVAVFSNRRKAFGLERARRADIPARFLSHRRFAERADFDATLGAQVAEYAPDLVVLAGFMRVLGARFLRRFGDRVLNLHPALPGELPGTRAIERAHAEARDGARLRTGVMVHRVVEEVDAGPVLGTAEVPIDPAAPLADLEAAMHAAEHRLLVRAVAAECRRLAPARADDPGVVWPVKGPVGEAGDYRIFTVQRHAATHPQSGAARTFSVIRSSDWVNVIALTDDDAVVLVRQFRHGTGTVTVEIPGGMVDPGETFVEAGARELREETGYVADRWLDIGCVEPNPAIQDNRCGTVLALGARRVEAPDFDDGEFIAVQTAPLTEIRALIARGQITHSLVVAAFFHFVEHAGGWRRP